MNTFHKTAAILLAVSIMSKMTHAQTTYGVGAGTKGATNAFFGANAGKVNTITGLGNTFIGHNAGSSNTMGSSNTFLGAAAGFENNTGSFNTFMGEGSGFHNTIGGHNSFIGYQSGLYNLSGENNTFLGHYSGQANSTGSDNLFLGAYAGYQRTSGDFNCIIGSNANCCGSGGNHNNIIGYKAGALNNGSYNVFVGDNTGFFNKLGMYNAFLGSEAGHSNSTGSNNAFFGYGAGYSNATGEKNTYLGYASGGNATLNNATAIGALAKVTASNSLVLGNNANVGIGLTAPAYQLHLSTDLAAKLGTPVWTVASDRRLKKDITDFTDGLAVVKRIKPVWFSYNGEAGAHTGDKKFVGIIAQEMQQIAPYTIGSFNYQDSSGNKTAYLDYDAGAVTYLLINAVKEQQKTIEELVARLEKLEGSGITHAKIARTLNLQPSEGNGDVTAIAQNAPNGFSEQTVIPYYIPDQVKSAVLQVTNASGSQVSRFPILERGKGHLTISADTLDNGVYLYELISDGKSSGAKKMIVSK